MNISKISINYGYVFGESRMTKLPHHFVNRCYPFIVMVYVESGTYFVKINKTLYEVHKGEALVVPEFTQHDVWMIDPGELSWAHITAHIFNHDILSFFRLPIIYRGEDAALLGQTAQKLSCLSGLDQSAELLPGGRSIYNTQPEPGESDVYSKANIAPMLDADILVSCRLKVNYDEMVAHLLRIILGRAENATSLNDESYRWVFDVSQYVRDRIHTQINLDQLATAFQMSVRKFSTEFRRYFSQSPIDYVINEKIKYSTWLLLNGTNVKTAAIELGFTDSYYFTRQFKKRMGCSPTQYKANYRSQHPGA